MGPGRFGWLTANKVGRVRYFELNETMLNYWQDGFEKCLIWSVLCVLEMNRSDACGLADEPTDLMVSTTT